MKVTLFILSVLSAFALAHGPDEDGDSHGAMAAAPMPTAKAPLPAAVKPSNLPKAPKGYAPKAAAPKPANGMAGMSHGHGGMGM